jgi:hypothetical protein
VKEIKEKERKGGRKEGKKEGRTQGKKERKGKEKPRKNRKRKRMFFSIIDTFCNMDILSYHIVAMNTVDLNP